MSNDREDFDAISTPMRSQMAVIQSEQLDALAAALAAAQGEMPDAIKDSTNPHFRSSYADLASVRRAVREPLARNGLAITQTVVPRSEPNCRGALRTTLIHKSGQWIAGEQDIVGDWTKPQAIGAAISYARRYGLAGITGV